PSRSRHTRFSRDWSSDVCSSDLREIRDRVGHDIEMLTGVERYFHTRHKTDFPSPHATAIDDIIRRDPALLGDYADNLPLLRLDPSNLSVLKDRYASVARSLRQGQRNIGGIRLTIFREKDAALDILAIQQRIDR